MDQYQLVCPFRPFVLFLACVWGEFVLRCVNFEHSDLNNSQCQVFKETRLAPERARLQRVAWDFSQANELERVFLIYDTLHDKFRL